MEKSPIGFAVMAVLLIFISFDYPGQPEKYALTIKAKELRNSIGIVQFTLYNKVGSIPDEKYQAYYKQETATIIDGRSSVTFAGLPKGRYAVNALHDENKNGKIDKGLILPIEGIGFSKYTSIGLTNRPNFAKASFMLNSDTTLVVKVIYK